MSIADKWYRENSMLNNSAKTQIIVISNKSKAKKRLDLTFKIQQDNTEIYIKPQKTIKILGVIIDETLSFDSHISSVRSNITNTVRNLHRVNNLLPQKAKMLLYNAQVASRFNYADIIWGQTSCINQEKLQRTQNFAVKSMYGRRKYDSCSDIYKNLKLLKLVEKRDVHYGVFAHKALHGKTPITITKKILDHLPNEYLRSAAKAKLNMPIHKTSTYTKSTIYKSIQIWNSLPNSLRNITNQTTFKQSLQKHKLQTQYKTV